MTTKTSILSDQNFRDKLQRIAYQIYERNYEETEIVLLGIEQKGGFIASTLQSFLYKMSPIQILHYQVNMQRNEEGKMQMNWVGEIPLLVGKSVIVIDDVLYSGRTLLSTFSHILNYAPKSIQAFVLVDRGHRLMPISPDYVGMRLATTLQQHVSFEIDGDEKAEVFLM